MRAQVPSIGRIVHVLVEPNGGLAEPSNNGSEIAPAIITRVWSEHPDHWVVNYRILRDGNDAPEWKTSAALYADEATARAAAGASGRRAFWPGRV